MGRRPSFASLFRTDSATHYRAVARQGTWVGFPSMVVANYEALYPRSPSNSTGANSESSLPTYYHNAMDYPTMTPVPSVRITGPPTSPPPRGSHLPINRDSQYYSGNYTSIIESPESHYEGALTDGIQIEHEVPEVCQKLRADLTGADVAIITNDKKIYVHKELLSARIPFFHGLFNSNMVECSSGEVDLSHFDFHTMKSLVDYAYTGKIRIAKSNVQDLMVGAHFLQMITVLDECNQFMRSHIEIESVLSLYRFCRSYASDETNEAILKFIDKHFIALSFTADLLELPADDFVVILQRDTLNVKYETQVFDALSNWIGDDYNKKKQAGRLLQCIRCTCIPLARIKEIVSEIEWVNNDPTCIQLFYEANQFLHYGKGGESFKNFPRYYKEIRK